VPLGRTVPRLSRSPHPAAPSRPCVHRHGIPPRAAASRSERLTAPGGPNGISRYGCRHVASPSTARSAIFRAATSSHTETLSNRRYHRPSDRALPRVEKFAPRLWSLSRPLMDRTEHDVPFATSNAGLVVRVLRSLGGSRYRHSSAPPPGPGFRGARASARRAHDPSAFVVPPIQRAGAPMSVTASTARPDPRRRSRLWTRRASTGHRVSLTSTR
jgi:hypothetical protein